MTKPKKPSKPAPRTQQPKGNNIPQSRATKPRKR